MIRHSLKITASCAFEKQITNFLNCCLSLNSEFKERYLPAVRESDVHLLLQCFCKYTIAVILFDG